MAGRFSVEAIFKAVDRITGPIARMQKSVEGFAKNSSKQLKDLDAAIGDVHGGLSKAAAAATAGAVAAGAAIYNVVSAGADFEQAITNVAAVSLMTRDQIADLEKKALELGASTKFSATEVANGMELMGKAGFMNGQILEGIGGIMAAAAADGGELADTAGTISNVMRGMDLAASETNRVADVLTLASARTNSSINSLGESMKMLGPVAKQFKIPMEEAVAMAALLQDVGLDASAAGTSAASALTKLAKPSRQAKAMMQKMGVAFKDANGNMLPATEIFAQMAKAVHNSNGNMEQAAFFAELVGLESQKAAINLTNAFMSGKATGLIKELNSAKGSAEAMAAIRMQTLRGDFEQLGGAVETLKINLFNMQSGPLRGIVQGLTKWIEANSGLIQSGVQQFIAEAVPLIVAFGRGVWAGVLAVQGWARSLQSAIGPFGDLFGASSAEKIQNAAWLGQTLVKGIVIFYAFSAGVKVARVAMLAFHLATKATQAAIWLFTTATRAAQGAMVLYQIATKAGTGATIAMSFASKAATLDLIRQKAAAFAAAGGVTKLAKAGGAAAAAFAAWSLAIDQNEELKKLTGGLGFFDIAGKMIEEGEWDPAKVVDRHQNALAKADFDKRMAEKAGGPAAGGLDAQLAALEKSVGAESALTASLDELTTALVNERTGLGGNEFGPPLAPQVASPQARTAHSVAETRQTVQTEITIKDQTGSAEVTKKPPAGGPVRVRVGASGAF